MSHFYISYDQTDGLDFAKSVSTTLESGLPKLSTWVLDIHSKEIEDKYTEATLAIQTCKAFILIQTPNIFNSESRINSELKKAIGYKKPIIIIRNTHNTDVLPRLIYRKAFTITDADYEQSIKNHLSLIDSDPQKLKTVEEYLKDAENDLLYNSNIDNKKRIENDIENLKNQISGYQELIENFDAITKRTEERIELSIERERQPKSTKKLIPVHRIINTPPVLAPSYFQNRTLELSLIKDFICQDSSRLATIVGRGGIGKTTLICKLLKALEKGKWPNEDVAVDISGIIYMNEVGNRPISFPNLFNDLSLLVEETKRKELRELQNNAQSTVFSKLNKLITYLPTQPIIVLLDNFEDKINQETRQILDKELEDAILHLIDLTNHSIKLIITTRVSSKNILLHQPSRQINIELDEGLKSPHAENVLRKLDANGHIGLKNANEQLLMDIMVKTRGFPRALEAFYAILSADRTTSINELINSINKEEGLTQILVGEAFNRLSDIDQKIMQALAVYGFPVLPSAVDFLLKSYIPNINSSIALKRLVNMRLVRIDNGKEFYLHPIDREYALSRLEDDNSHEPNKTLISNSSLYSTAAQYMRAISIPRWEWSNLDDILPQTREFHLLIESGQLHTASEILELLSSFLGEKGGFSIMLEMAKKIEEFGNDIEVIQIAYQVMAHGYWRTGHLKKSIEYHKKNIQILKNLNDDDSIFIAEANLLIVEQVFKTPEENLNSFKGILNKTKKQYPWNKQFLELSNHYIAGEYVSLGYFDKAIEHALTALKIAEEYSDVDSIEAQNHNYATSLRNVNRDDAIEFYKKALELSEESGNPLWKSNHLAALSSCNSDMGDYEQATLLIRQAIEIRIKIRDINGEAQDIKQMANCLLGNSEFKDAKKIIEIALLKATELRVPLNYYYELSAEILLALGETTKALDHIKKALKNNRGSSFSKNNLAGVISSNLNKDDQSLIFFNKALEEANIYISRSSKNASAFAAKGLAYSGIFKLKKDISNKDKALKAYQTSRKLDDGLGKIKKHQRIFNALNLEKNQEELLNAITGKPTVTKKVNTRNKKTPLKVFISYSKFDGENTKDGINYLEEFKTFLAPLITSKKLIQTWDDTLLIPGEDWDERIVEQLKTCDIIFLLVSPDFLNTKYILEVELEIAVQRHQRNECVIVPIFIKPSGFEDIEILNKLSGIPRKGFTISGYKKNKKEWPTREAAWKHIYNQTKLTIESFLSNKA